MPEIFKKTFDTPAYKGDIEFNTGLFINGKWVDGSDGDLIEVINPSTGKLITKVAGGSAKDVDAAVIAAQKAFDTVWGHNTPGSARGELLFKLAELMKRDEDKLAATEALDNEKTFGWAKKADLALSIGTIQYYAGWADKIQGSTIETSLDKIAYTTHEPIGVVDEAGFPPGVVNIVNGYGASVGNAISHHPHIDKVAFTGSTLVGRKVLEAAAKTNLKETTLELGGKSPNIIFDDCDIEQALEWTVHGIFWNHGQACCAGSRIFVHAKIYDEFLAKFTEKTKKVKLGSPFDPTVYQGPQVSQQQFDRIMSYIDSGKAEGATVHLGGERFGQEGYYIQPTIFTDVKRDMKIVQEEIFGPVGVVIKFEDDDDVIRQANDTIYGLAAAIFTKNIDKALRTSQKLRAGTTWINCANQLHPQIPFGGYKQSGIGRELGEYALEHYTSVKAVHINLGPNP